MALTTPIEVRAGADTALRVGLWLVWLAALASSLAHWPQLSPGLICLVVALLIWSFPLRTRPALAPHRLLLQPNGQVTIAAEEHREKSAKPGTWKRSIWQSRWYTVVCIEHGGRHWRAWISSRNNSPDVYRRLSVWSRYSPQHTNVQDRQ